MLYASLLGQQSYKEIRREVRPVAIRLPVGPYGVEPLLNECPEHDYFEMIPPQWNASKDSLLDNGHGVAYQLLRDGSRKELWRTDGWYSGRIFLAEGGVYLVRLESEQEGHHISQGDLALAFYRNGTLIKQYSTAELVKNPEKVVSTVSHYYWLASDVQRIGGNGFDADAEPRLLLNNTFRIKTCDGLVHVFDVTSGNLK